MHFVFKVSRREDYSTYQNSEIHQPKGYHLVFEDVNENCKC